MLTPLLQCHLSLSSYQNNFSSSLFTPAQTFRLVKNGRHRVEETWINQIILLAHQTSEKQRNEPNWPFSSKAPVAI